MVFKYSFVRYIKFYEADKAINVFFEYSRK